MKHKKAKRDNNLLEINLKLRFNVKLHNYSILLAIEEKCLLIIKENENLT